MARLFRNRARGRCRVRAAQYSVSCVCACIVFFVLFFIIDKEGDIDSVLFENTLLRSSRQYAADHQSMHSPERFFFVSQLE